MFIQKVKEDESKIAMPAIRQFGSIDKYTEAMKYNLEHFSEIVDKELSKEQIDIIKHNDVLYHRLTAAPKRRVSSDEVQQIVQEIFTFMQNNITADFLERSYWDMITDTYSNDYIKAVTDTKYGAGAADYIVDAFQYYGKHNTFGNH